MLRERRAQALLSEPGAVNIHRVALSHPSPLWVWIWPWEWQYGRQWHVIYVFQHDIWQPPSDYIWNSWLGSAPHSCQLLVLFLEISLSLPSLWWIFKNCLTVKAQQKLVTHVWTVHLSLYHAPCRALDPSLCFGLSLCPVPCLCPDRDLYPSPGFALSLCPALYPSLGRGLALCLCLCPYRGWLTCWLPRPLPGIGRLSWRSCRGTRRGTRRGNGITPSDTHCQYIKQVVLLICDYLSYRDFLWALFPD